MKIHKSIVMAFSAIAFVGYSQDQTDALRYSQTFFGGTARYEAMAGSFGALGADLSVVNTNPAGLGRFSQNQFTLTANNNFLSSKSLYNGTSASAKGAAFALSNLGALVALDRTSRGKGWHYIQLGFTYNRTTNYQNRQYYEGQNYNSLLDGFAAQGAGVDPTQIYQAQPFTTALAWDTYAIDWDPNNGVYIPRLTSGDMYHKRTITSKGGVSTYNFSFSANYVEKIYIGGSIGIQRINYKQNYQHDETLLDTTGVSLRSFEYDYSQTTKGFGVNLNLGVIYLPTNELRLGLAFSSPTISSFKESWESNMTSYHSDMTYTVPLTDQPQGYNLYRMVSPLKLTGSLAYVAMKRLAMNVDFEYTGYNWSRLKPSHSPSVPYYDFKTENAAIKDIYRNVVNLRLGAEFAITSAFFIRGGFAYYPSPYKTSVQGASGATTFYTCGVGYKWQKFYIDLTYKLQKYNRNYYAFNPSDSKNLTQFKNATNGLLLSVGFRF